MSECYEDYNYTEWYDAIISRIKTAVKYPLLKIDYLPISQSDMLAEQRVLLQKSIERADKFEEQARILLRENVDLKDYLNSLGLLDQSMLSTSDVLTEDSVGDIDE